jgi:outer membrane protein TolC
MTAFVIGLALLWVSSPVSAATGKTVDECVAIAVKGSGQVVEAEGKVSEWKARLAEVESVFYPKITALAFAAPTFSVKGSALEPDVHRDYGRWGPYLSFEGLLAQPIYTFGQAAAGKTAARERLAVEEARLAQARNAVALEVYHYYFLHLYIKSLTPTLLFAAKTLEKVESKAKALYDEGIGKVTNVELMKLRYAATQLAKYRVQAEIGLPLSLAALKHTMGLAESAPLELSDAKLPGLEEGDPPPIPELVRTAWEKRPELSQLKHGRKAALSFEEAERLAYFPIVLLAGQLAASWTPVRTDAKNPYWYDPWNDISGGIALALKWDFDPAKVHARGKEAHATVQQLDGMARFASTGIPLEVRRARDDVIQARQFAVLSEEGALSTRKWMLFAAAAYETGTGDSRDLLEGIAAFVAAKKDYFDALLAAHESRARLAWTVGEIAAHSPGRPTEAQKNARSAVP